MPSLLAFLDELTKIGSSAHTLAGSKSRSGRRPMSVSTLLRKEKDGSLYKYTKAAAASSSDAPYEESLNRPFTEAEAARLQEAAGEIPFSVMQSLARKVHLANALAGGELPPALEGEPGSFVAVDPIRKFADAVNTRFLEGSAENDRGAQVPTTAKKRPGDSPTSDTASAYGMGSKMNPVWTPPETAIPSKLATVLRDAKKPGGDAADRGENSSPRRIGDMYPPYMHTVSSHDAKPITEVETDGDAYSRA